MAANYYYKSKSSFYSGGSWVDVKDLPLLPPAAATARMAGVQHRFSVCLSQPDLLFPFP
jgi:hypothetical protein